MNPTPYTVELENYSGPLDVLLQLIQREKLDICDISLSTVTNDYLRFMHQTSLDQHSANWFLEFAVKLILFKSRALLPSEQYSDNEEEIEDLTEQLRILARFQDAARSIGALQAEELVLQPETVESRESDEYTNLTIDDIVDAYTQLQSTAQAQPTQTFRLKRQTNREIQNVMLKKLQELQKLSLEDIASFCHSREEAVVVFMLILELIKSNRAGLNQTAHTTQVEMTV